VLIFVKIWYFVNFDTECHDIYSSRAKSISNSEEPTMCTQQQARALMMRHQHAIKNRQQSLLSRAAAEIGLEGENVSWTQGQASSSGQNS
jgi:hypothetical protein